MTSHIDILVTVIQLCVIKKGIEDSETMTLYINFIDYIRSL